MPYCRCRNHTIPGPHMDADCPMYDPDDPRIAKGLPPYAEQDVPIEAGAKGQLVYDKEERIIRGAPLRPVVSAHPLGVPLMRGPLPGHVVHEDRVRVALNAWEIFLRAYEKTDYTRARRWQSYPPRWIKELRREIGESDD